MLKACVPWPEAHSARYSELGLWRGEILGDIARDLATREPERVAVVEGARRVTYGELDRRAQRLAGGVVELGVRAGDRVVVGLPNSVAFVELMLALLRLGAVPVLALPAHRRSELEHLCRRTRARALVVPDRGRAFDFRVMAEEIKAAVPGLEHVLVAGEPGTVPGARRHRRAGAPAARAPRRRRRLLPALRGDDGHAEADPAHPRRLRLPAADHRRGRLSGREPGVSRGASGRAQCGARLPRSARDAADGGPGRAGPQPESGRDLPPGGARTSDADHGDADVPEAVERDRTGVRSRPLGSARGGGRRSAGPGGGANRPRPRSASP